MFTKTYTKNPNLLRLSSEIKQQLSGLQTIVNNGDGTLTVNFGVSLDSAQETTLDGIVTAHVAAPLPLPLIETLSNQAVEDFREIDYKILPSALHPVRSFDQGELTQVIWYTDDTLATPVLKVDIVYTRDTFGYTTFRTTTRTWYNSDGSENPKTSVRVKHYDEIKKQSEVKTRRENNILNVQANTLSYMVQTMTGDPNDILQQGRDFLASLDSEVDKYIKSGASDLSDAITVNTTDTWLDNIVPGDVITIRDYMTTELAL